MEQQIDVSKAVSAGLTVRTQLKAGSNPQAFEAELTRIGNDLAARYGISSWWFEYTV